MEGAGGRYGFEDPFETIDREKSQSLQETPWY
jgi:hypothetical protein